MTRDTDDKGYKVGRGKPPVHSRFKPGQSGNPRGRPKGSGTFLQDLIAAASESVTIMENGRKVRLSKQQVAVRQVVNKAASGDHRSLELLARHMSSTMVVEPPAALRADKVDLDLGTEDDEQVLAAFLQRSTQEGSR